MKRISWLIKDNEAGEIRRFYCNTNNPNVALRAYLHWLEPGLATKEVAQISADFNGEIWRENDVENIGCVDIYKKANENTTNRRC
jgi:hypothetical protein